MDHIPIAAALLYAASILAALGVLWRGVVRPLRRAVEWVRDVVEDWRQNLEAVRELTHVVARYIVESDRRITRLEALRDLDGVVHEHHHEETATLLGQQLENALRRPNTRSRHDDTE